MRENVMRLAQTFLGFLDSNDLVEDSAHVVPKFYDGSENLEEMPKEIMLLYKALDVISSDAVTDLVQVLSPAMGETLDELSERLGRPKEELEPILREGAHLGLVFICTNADGNEIFRREAVMPGIAETLCNGEIVTPEAAAFYEYYSDKAMPMMMEPQPLGRGGFRAYPVIESIDKGSRIMTYDEMKPYFDGQTLFSVSKCPCKMAAILNGKGGAHNNLETCIQVGEYAEAYLKGGRSRQLTRKEVDDLLEQCERDGLVHQAMVTEKGKSVMICNCNASDCINLRAVNLTNLPQGNKSNYVARVDNDKCTGCGACVEACNANALSLGTTLTHENPVLTNVPDRDSTAWSEEYWDKDYQIRKVVNSIGTSPCKTYCPAHISVQGYINKAHEGKFADALKVIKRENPFPAVCGRVCHRECEKHCSRGCVDEAIAIDDIKKYIADKELDSEFRFVPKIENHFNKRIAVIGGGPAGLTCAYFAASYGFRVTVFEKQETLGGMMMKGIPSFRLDKNVVEAEIDVLRELGVEFRCGVEIGKDFTIPELRALGYDAFYIAIGLQDGGSLNIPGGDAEGVISGIDFMKQVNGGKEVALSGKVMVIGGGNIGADVARTALRCGAESVKMYCLEEYDDMPMGFDDRSDCEAEGVEIHAGWGQTEILVADGKCAGINFRKCVSVKDENGRFAPVFDDSVTASEECTTVLFCIGQKIDWGTILEGLKVETSAKGLAVVDPMTYESGESDIFIGGDAVTGQKFVIDAIAAGKEGAISLRRYLLGGNLKLRRERNFFAFDTEKIDVGSYDHQKRERVAAVNTEEAKKSFKDMRATLTDEQIMKETSRCLGCGVNIVDEYKCIGCGICGTKCEFDAIKLHRVTDIDPTDTYEEFLQKYGEYAMQKAAAIAARENAM